MFEHWIRIKDQMSTNKSRFPLIHVIESPNRPRIRIQYWPSTMCFCQVVSLSGVSGKGFWAPHCGYRRYFSSQRRCITAVLLCTSGGLLSLVNIKSTHPPLPNWYSSNWNGAPGTGRERELKNATGREIWGLYSQESRETGIPAHPWLAHFRVWELVCFIGVDVDMYGNICSKIQREVDIFWNGDFLLLLLVYFLYILMWVGGDGGNVVIVVLMVGGPSLILTDAAASAATNNNAG